MSKYKYNKVIVVMKHDLTIYPPVISILQILRKFGIEVVYIGANSNSQIYDSMINIGVKMLLQPIYRGNSFSRLLQQLGFKARVTPLIKANYDEKSLIWFVHYETVILLKNFFFKYNCFAHLLEFRTPIINLRYRLLIGFSNMKKVLQHSKCVICCEYNRAHLTQVFFNLRQLPTVMPNKMYIENEEDGVAGNDEIEHYKNILKDKKVIIYQGAFMPERKLDSFCEAIKLLPKEYVFVGMGGDSEEKRRLKKLYEGDRFIFLPHIRPPYHMEITKLAHIGILSYIPLGEDISQELNVLYCAPNKIFEYGRFGIPMLSNDLPSLKLQFAEIKCGEIVKDGNYRDIVNVINKIESDYTSYKNNAFKLYDSVDIVKIVDNLLRNDENIGS